MPGDQHRSIYDVVTHAITRELAHGAVPWVKPWKTGISPHPRNAVSQRPYRGVNILLLWGTAIERGYDNPTWLTFAQARELGGTVRKGEHGTRIVYASSAKKVEQTEDGQESQTAFRLLKWYTVFNVEQTERLPERLYQCSLAKPITEALEHVEPFLAQIGADVRHGGDKAYPSPLGDFIALPHRDRFLSTSAYYATSLHEHAHWSGHPERLHRDLSGRYGSRAYAAEELIAELTAAFLCAALDISGALRHAGYIKSWLELLENDRRAIFTAASAASRAADYLRLRGEHGEWVREYNDIRQEV